jgi:protein involved in polysaccharide export with SLBB domain
LKSKIILTIFLLLTTSIINDLYSQEEKRENVFDRENKKYPSSLERLYLQKSITRTMAPQVLEDILDEDTYIVGPGDGFEIYLWGELENQFDATVNPHGSLIIPSVGEIDLHDMTLAQSRVKIQSEIVEKYLSNEISISLVTLKKFRIYLAGEIELPGTYFVQASDRVSDVLEIANGVTDWADGTRIEIRENSGNKKYIDLSEFYLDGVKEQNPYLNSGDVIYVPSIDVTRGYVIVEGNAEIASTLATDAQTRAQQAVSSLLGVYALKENEKLYDFMRRVGALSKKSDLEDVVIKRMGKDYHLDLLEREEEFVSFTLQDKDKIVITPIIDQVYVSGEVFRPGKYPFKANFRASDYVGTAGELETGADPEDYEILRRETGEVFNGGNVIIEKGDTIIVPKSGGEKFKDFMIVITPGLSMLATVLILAQGFSK